VVGWRYAMGFLFETDDWNHLDTIERIDRCRIMAEEAMDHAALCSSSLRTAYLSIAGEWLELAAEIARASELYHPP
jgi:hypothetical protein